jgi:hypothetical protein
MLVAFRLNLKATAKRGPVLDPVVGAAKSSRIYRKRIHSNEVFVGQTTHTQSQRVASCRSRRTLEGVPIGARSAFESNNLALGLLLTVLRQGSSLKVKLVEASSRKPFSSPCIAAPPMRRTAPLDSRLIELHVDDLNLFDWIGGR